MSNQETLLQTAMVTAIRQLGVWVIVMNVTKRRSKRGVNCGEPGMPDLWTEYGWGEVKLPGNDLEPDQVVWHDRARRRGIRVGTWRSVAEAVDMVLVWQTLTRIDATRRQLAEGNASVSKTAPLALRGSERERD